MTASDIWICPTCRQAFTSLADWGLHQRTHLADPRGPHCPDATYGRADRCPVCGGLLVECPSCQSFFCRDCRHPVDRLIPTPVRSMRGVVVGTAGLFVVGGGLVWLWPHGPGGAVGAGLIGLSLGPWLAAMIRGGGRLER